MSLLLAYTFNEQSITPWDYSGNKLLGSSRNVAFTAGQSYGYAIELGQVASQSYVAVTPTNFTGLTAFSMFTSFNLISLPSGANKAYICFQSGSFSIYLNASGNVAFTLQGGGIGNTVTSAGTITTGWNTVGCVWDGTTMYIYINGVVDANTLALASKTSNNNNIFIGNDTGSDTSNTLVANMDCIEFRSAALAASDISILNTSPGGVNVVSPNNFAMGDLIADPSVSYLGCVTWAASVDSFYYYPLTAVAGSYARIGNIYTALRQYYMEFNTDFDTNGNGQISIKYPIAGIGDYQSPANTITFDYRGLTGAPDTTQNMMAITSLRI